MHGLNSNSSGVKQTSLTCLASVSCKMEIILALLWWSCRKDEMKVMIVKPLHNPGLEESTPEMVAATGNSCFSPTSHAHAGCTLAPVSTRACTRPGRHTYWEHVYTVKFPLPECSFPRHPHGLLPTTFKSVLSSVTLTMRFILT